MEHKMSDENKPKNVRVDISSLTGMIWFGGWLFTIAFAKLAFWPAILGLIIWPYYLGMVAH
jgi:hypothetical protein